MEVRGCAPVAVAAGAPAWPGVPARPRRALVVAPAGIGPALARAWARACRHDTGPELEVEVAELPGVAGPTRDPLGLRELLPALASTAGAEVVLVVVPRRRGLARSVPGIVVPAGETHGAVRPAPVVVGVVQDDRPEELAGWLEAVRARRRLPEAEGGAIVVAAMGKDRYLDVAGTWAGRLEAGGLAVRDLRADRVRRAVLCEGLAAGPGAALYLGHGSDVGWGGYQTVRWRHVAAVAPVAPAGVVVAAACATLRRTHGVVPFGTRLVASGRAAAYLGAVRLLANDDVERLGDAFVDELVSGRHADVASLLSAMATGAGPELASVLEAFRLVGDPLTPLPAGRVSGLDASRGSGCDDAHRSAGRERS